MKPISPRPQFAGCYQVYYQGTPLPLNESRNKDVLIEQAYEQQGDRQRVYCTMSGTDQTLKIVSGQDVRGYILTLLQLLQSPAATVKQATEMSLEALAPFVQANIARWPLARRQEAADRFLADKALTHIHL